MKTYLKLPEGAIFQKRPGGATIYLKEDASAWGKKKRLGVNLDGARLLGLCGEGDTASGIVERHNALYPGSPVAQEKAAGFFAKAVKAGMLTETETVSGAGARICGSHEHYYPEHTTVEVTSQCNYSCKHCYRGSSPSANQHIDYDKLLRYLGEFKANGGSVIEITGGEPMLYARFFDLVDWACANLEVVGILTNGYYLQEEAIKRLLPYKNKLVFNISLDSHRPEFHDAFRGKEGAFEKTCRAMELLGANGFRFRLSMSVTRENFFDMEATAELAKKYGAVYFGCNPVQDFGRGGDLAGGLAADFEKEPQKYIDYERMIHEKFKGFLHTLSEGARKGLETGNCGIVHRTVTVGPDGELRPCAMFDSGLRIGNIYRQSFEEIFRSPLGEAFSRMKAPGGADCEGCAKRQACKGCILRGIRNGQAKGGCKWLENTGVEKFISASPRARNCANGSEPYYG